jgi:membrane protein YdbS with pleckstrin-like domain
MVSEDSANPQRDSTGNLESTYKELPFVIKPYYWAFFLSQYLAVIVLLALSCLLFALNILGLIVLEQLMIFGSILLSGALFLLALIHAKIRLIFMKYALDRNAVIKQWGVVRRNTFNIPLEMVTDVGIKREMLDHLTGTGSLVINTASSAGVVGFPYILLKRSHEMEQKVLSLKRILLSKQGDGQSGQYLNLPK